MNTNADDKPDMMRRMIEWAIAAGRTFQSPQTGYIHYYNAWQQSGMHHTTPIYENALFALALLRSRLIENVKEAQTLLTQILAFQNLDEGPSRGNFPYYLHEFPYCRDLHTGIKLMAPFYWILKGFGHVLGQELRSKLENSIENLIQYGLNAHQKRPFAYSIDVLFAAALEGFGSLLKNHHWSQEGTQKLDHLMVNPAMDSWQHTDHLADLLIASQMTQTKLNNSMWKHFWHFIGQTWHPQLASYCGPCVSEKQELFEPAMNLYDIFLGYLTGQFAARTNKLKIDHLQAALIYPFPEVPGVFDQFLTEEIVSGKHQGQSWMCIKHPNWACTLLEKSVAMSEKREKTYTPLRFMWGGFEATHTLVCQGGESARIGFNWQEPVIELIFDLEGTIEGNSEKSREICFYFDIYPDLIVSVNGQRTTTFELNQKVNLHLGVHQEVDITFELLEGEGQFLGHVAQANRPSQMKQMEDKKSQAYDWILFLRTLRRSDKCRVRVTIDLSKICPAISGAEGAKIRKA